MQNRNRSNCILLRNALTCIDSPQWTTTIYPNRINRPMQTFAKYGSHSNNAGRNDKRSPPEHNNPLQPDSSRKYWTGRCLCWYHICRPIRFMDLMDTVRVQAIVRISLKSYTTVVKLAANGIILQSGQRCQLQQGSCLDSEDGYTFWESLPTDYCNFNRYDILFEGKATKLSSQNQDSPTIYTVTTEETICGYRLIKTEHPKLFIIETTNSGRFKCTSKTPVNNLDIFTYVNSKIGYVEKHIKNQLANLYQDIIEQKCALQRQIIRNALDLVHISPEEVAHIITKEPGYMAIASGEVVHLIECIPVVCQTRRTEDCFEQLPVSYKTSSYFLTPKHRTLTRVGTRKECNAVIPTQFKLHGACCKLMPNPVQTIPPQSIQPISKSKWKYIDPQNLANGGI